ncbi:MAG: family 10 glycosylhydrolase, partial [Erysipelothrix sp.]
YVQKRVQFKSSWIATIFNLHFPQVNTEKEFISKYEERLDQMESWNMNAVIFQVSPLLDAFYPSELNPTSQFLSGKQGQDVNYDPLEYMVKATHDRGMEFHAWFNPYRVTNSDIEAPAILSQVVALGYTAEEVKNFTPAEQVKALNELGHLSNDNFAVKNPHLVLKFQGKLFLNPGEPDVIKHVADTVKEVVTKYDIDAVHYDDYFYPYKGALRKDAEGKDIPGSDVFGTFNEDRETFLKYQGKFEDTPTGIEAWRRDNVTKLVDAVNDVLKTHNETTKSAVQFGISPFGIWEHKANDPRGSNTPAGSSQSYSKTIFADTYQWIKDGKLDYISPQIYWSFSAPAAPYGEIARWWDSVVEGTDVKLYVGHANYKHTSNGGWDADWMNPDEINNQMKFNQKLKNISGSSIYSYADIVKSDIDSLDEALRPRNKAKNDSIDILKSDSFSKPSLTPSHKRLSPKDTSPLHSASIKDGKLVWTDTLNNNARFYVIYKGTPGQTVEEIIAAGNIVERVNFEAGKNNVYNLEDVNAAYAITVLDKAYVETTGVKAKTVEPLSVTFTEKSIKVKVNSGLTETELLELVKVVSNHETAIATDFTQKVDLSKVGEYTVNIKVTSSVTDEVFEGNVVVNVEADTPIEPEVKPDPEVKPNPEVKPEGKLPGTGVSSNSMFIVGGLVVMGSILVLYSRKKKTLQ